MMSGAPGSWATTMTGKITMSRPTNRTMDGVSAMPSFTLKTVAATNSSTSDSSCDICTRTNDTILS